MLFVHSLHRFRQTSCLSIHPSIHSPSLFSNPAICVSNPPHTHTLWFDAIWIGVCISKAHRWLDFIRKTLEFIWNWKIIPKINCYICHCCAVLFVVDSTLNPHFVRYFWFDFFFFLVLLSFECNETKTQPSILVFGLNNRRTNLARIFILLLP